MVVAAGSVPGWRLNTISKDGVSLMAGADHWWHLPRPCPVACEDPSVPRVVTPSASLEMVALSARATSGDEPVKNVRVTRLHESNFSYWQSSPPPQYQRPEAAGGHRANTQNQKKNAQITKRLRY